MAQANSSKKIVDVAKPGDTGPNATAKPVIVGHGSMIKEDPMVANTNDASETPTDTSSSEKLTKKSEKVIVAPVESEEPTKSEKTVEPAEDKTSTESTDEEPPKEDKISASEQAAVDAVAEQADKDKKKKAEPTEEEKARSAAIQKLIDDKKYYVSISATRRQRKAMHSLLILLLLVIVIAGCVYLLIDAGVVDIGVELPFEVVN